MRIIYHHRTRGRHVEGVHIRGVVNALRELGHQVTVLSFPGADPEREPVAQKGTGRPGRLAGIVTRLPGVLFEFMELAYNPVTLVRMSMAIRRERPQLIYERYSLFLCATVWLARRLRIPLVLEINDSALVERVRPLRLKSLARRMESWCLRNCTGLVFISSYFKQQAESAYGAIAPSVISPNAADLTRFDPGRFDAVRLRAERGLSGRVVCGHIGAFAHWHGMDAFVEAIAARIAEVPHLTLVLVGDGRTLPAIRNLVAERGLAERVLLPGRVAHDDIASWIACMDYAVLPDSNQYGSPMKLFEFMAMGVAMVAPDYAPIAEVVSDGHTGWLFPRRQTDACVQRVLDLATQADERRRVGTAAREYIIRERQWRNNAEQLLTLLPIGAPR
ncbi:glycosyltransferase family 4 protein [Rhodanobacter sp. C03]|uniref:glycosyltransferase family 4 protein n=1 Tax=Rhodanobacter sp. C03 TaxID=1945858 RepID=UPI0009873EFD|nr:glycosyltransferase family 4 protein [Rhodanobacter sp. C03]OOG53673.1 glycosyltransferase WbuB [Rhodanobacter sp. C03]